jgi:hypothetical protein
VQKETPGIGAAPQPPCADLELEDRVGMAGRPLVVPSGPEHP